MSSIDDEPPGEHKGGGGGDFAKNVAESVTTINSSDDGIDDGKIWCLFITLKAIQCRHYTHL